MKSQWVIACKDTMFIYGDYNKCFITVRKRQKWLVTGLPSPKLPYFSLWRNGITIQILRDDYISRFKEVQSE